MAFNAWQTAKNVVAHPITAYKNVSRRTAQYAQSGFGLGETLKYAFTPQSAYAASPDATFKVNDNAKINLSYDPTQWSQSSGQYNNIPSASTTSQPKLGAPGLPTTYPGQASAGTSAATASQDSQYAKALRDADLQASQKNEDLATYMKQWEQNKAWGAQDIADFRNEIAAQRGQVQSATGQQRDYANTDYQNFMNQLNSTVGRQKTDLGQQNTDAQRQLSGNYSARGLSDSSFSGTAQANLSNQYQTTLDRLSQDEGFQRMNAETTFKRNIKSLDDAEREKLSTLDTYLKQEESKYDRQLVNADWQKAATSQDYKRKLDDLQSYKDEVSKARAELHSNTNSYVSGVSGNVQGQGQVNTQAQAKALQEFTSGVSQLANLTAPPQQKSQYLQQLAGQYYKPGTKEYDHVVNWYEDWMTANDMIRNREVSRDQVNQQFIDKYGSKAF